MQVLILVCVKANFVGFALCLTTAIVLVSLAGVVVSWVLQKHTIKTFQGFFIYLAMPQS